MAGGQEWVLWTELAAAEIVTVQLLSAQIKAIARSRGTRAKTDRIGAELISGFMHCPAGACKACCRAGHSDPGSGESCQMRIYVFSEP